MSHVIASETGMTVARLMRFVKRDEKIMVQVRWKGLSKQENTLEPVCQVFEDVLQMLIKLLQRSTRPNKLADEVRNMLDL